LVAGDKSWGSAAAAERRTPKESRTRGSRGSSSRQPLQAAVFQTPVVTVAAAAAVAASCWPQLGGNRYAALAAEEAEEVADVTEKAEVASKLLLLQAELDDIEHDLLLQAELDLALRGCPNFVQGLRIMVVQGLRARALAIQQEMVGLRGS
jgi:hypothetical protein